jgi:hypothetical protein
MVDMNVVCAYIKNQLKNTSYPVESFFLFFGILLGCDFIKNVHNVLQKNQYSDTTAQFMELLFGKVLPTYGKVLDMEKTNGILTIKIRKRNVLAVFNECLAKQNLPELEGTKLTKIKTTLRNGNYVANYMTTQHRLETCRERKEPYIPCDTKNKNGDGVFGYTRCKYSGKIVTDPW